MFREFPGDVLGVLVHEVGPTVKDTSIWIGSVESTCTISQGRNARPLSDWREHFLRDTLGSLGTLGGLGRFSALKRVRCS